MVPTSDISVVKVQVAPDMLKAPIKYISHKWHQLEAATGGVL